MSNKDLILENLEKLKEAKKKDRFRFLAYSNAILVLKRFKTIDIKDLPELKKTKGIGKGIYSKIEEILKTKKLQAVLKLPPKSKKEKILDLFLGILGVGEKTANGWYYEGYRKLSDIDDGELNRTQKLGIKYYEDMKLQISRKEIKCAYDPYINYGLTKISEKYNLEFKYIIAGSYRRLKSVSNDIDVLITEKTRKYDNQELMNIIIKEFTKIKLIREELTKGKSKFTGLSKVELSKEINFPVRRFDIELVIPEDWYYALLYFTGSKTTNEKMRYQAKKQNYLLNQYGLFNLSDEKERFNAKSEKDIFKKLGMPYLDPEER